MRIRYGGSGLILALTLALAWPAAGLEPSLDAGSDVWQGQGQGRGQGQGNGGRGDDDRGQGRGERGRDDDDEGRRQGNPGRDNDDRGRGQGNPGRGNDDDARGRAGRGNDDDARGNPGRGNDGGVRGNSGRERRRDRPDPVVIRAHLGRMPASVRSMVTSSRRGDRLIAGAITRATLRGVDTDDVRFSKSGTRWTVRNDRDQVLFDIDDDRDLGYWEMRRLGDRRPNASSPSFCRSGEGHPVWGRDWCLEKGFGLGVSERSIWSRATVSDVVFRRRPTTAVLDRPSLIEVIGDVVFGRLAVQSLALGYDEPLVGRWVASTDEPDAPFVLRIHAGDVAVAELLDTDRDDDVDVLFVAQPRW